MKLTSNEGLMVKEVVEAPQRPTISELLETAGCSRSAGRVDEAEFKYRVVREIEPKNLGALIGLGHVAKSRGDLEASFRLFTTAASAHPGVVWPLAELGLLAREIGQLDQAEGYLRSCLSNSECSSELRAQLLVPLGCILLERGERTEAIRFFLEAVSIAPSFRWAQLELARASRAEKDLARSEAAYRAVLSLSSGDSDALSGLAYLARDAGNRSEALARFREAAQAHPEEPSPRAEIAVELCAAGQFDEAANAYRGLLAEFPDHPWGWIGLGQVYRQLGDRTRAVESFRRALTNNPKNVTAQLELAVEMREAEALADAEAIARRILEIDENCADAWASIGSTRLRRNDYPGAIAAMERAAELEADRIQYYIDIVDIHIKHGNYAAALASLKSALKRDPRNAYLFSRLGDISLLALDPAAALDNYQLSLLSNSRQPRSYMGSAQALADLGCVSDGLAILDTAEQQCGHRPEFFVRRAELLRRSGRLNEARETLSRAVNAYPNSFWLRGKQIELQILVGDIFSASRDLELVNPELRQERALWHFYRGQLAEAEWQLDATVTEYSKAIELNGEVAWWHHELARVNLLRLEPKVARKHLEEFARLGAAASTLQGRPTKPSQSHLGQIVDEFLLEADLVAEMRSLIPLPNDARAAQLVKAIHNNPESTAVAIAFLTFARQAGIFKIDGGYHYESVVTPTAIPRTIAQFWDSSDTPSDLTELISSWRALNPDFCHVLFNDETASKFMADRYPPEVVAAYQRAKEPAQKADIFRLAWLFAVGGYYADIDDRCLARIDTMAPGNTNLLLYQEEYGTVGNNFISAVPGHPVIGRALRRATTAINRGDRDLVWLSSGPALLSRALVEVVTQDLDWRLALKRIAIFDRGRFAQWVASHCTTAYKSTNRHWGHSAFQPRSARKEFDNIRDARRKA